MQKHPQNWVKLDISALFLELKSLKISERGEWVTGMQIGASGGLLQSKASKVENSGHAFGYAAYEAMKSDKERLSKVRSEAANKRWKDPKVDANAIQKDVQKKSKTDAEERRLSPNGDNSPSLTPPGLAEEIALTPSRGGGPGLSWIDQMSKAREKRIRGLRMQIALARTDFAKAEENPTQLDAAASLNRVNALRKMLMDEGADPDAEI